MLGAIGTIAGGRQAEAISSRNADLLNQQADATRRATVGKENLQRDRIASMMADQRARLLANGVDPGSGTAMVGVRQGMVDAEMDALTLRYEGLMQARDLNIQSDLTRWEGKAKKRQAYLSAAGQLMSAASGYMNQKQLPAPVESRTPTPSLFYRGGR